MTIPTVFLSHSSADKALATKLAIDLRNNGIDVWFDKWEIAPGDSFRLNYLSRDIQINRSNQVWGTDITYIRLYKGWAYLVAIMDWFSRYIVSWELSSGLEVDFCIRALEKAFVIGIPEIFNSDQGSQFTSLYFVSKLEQNNIQISVDRKGRVIENIFTERLWRTLKYEEVYIRDYQSVLEARRGISNYMNFYNVERPHQSLNDRTPAEVY